MDKRELESLSNTVPPIYCSVCNQRIVNDDDAVSEEHYSDIGVEVFGNSSEYIPEDFSHFTYRHRDCSGGEQWI